MTTTASYDHTAPRQHDAYPTHLEQNARALTALIAPAPLRAPGSRLGPEEDLPEDLTALAMADLQVLHSRITRQLDHDYLTDPAGPHPATMDRSFELAAELDARDCSG